MKHKSVNRRVAKVGEGGGWSRADDDQGDRRAKQSSIGQCKHTSPNLCASVRGGVGEAQQESSGT